MALAVFMKIKVNQSVAGSTWSYQRGQVVDLPEAEAASFVRSGLASFVEPPVESAVAESAKRTATLPRAAKR
jgi:hypothetical protein